MRNSAFILVTFLGLVSCASTQIDDQIKKGRATLLPTTVTVITFGANYKITGLVQAKDKRAGVAVYATDCQTGYGSVSGDSIYIENALASGAKPVDHLFADLCNLGMGAVTQMESKLSDQQRQQKQRDAIRAIINIQAAESAAHVQQQHDQAVRDAGKSVADAIKNQSEKTTDCQPNGNGFVCNTSSQ